MDSVVVTVIPSFINLASSAFFCSSSGICFIIVTYFMNSLCFSSSTRASSSSASLSLSVNPTAPPLATTMSSSSGFFSSSILFFSSSRCFFSASLSIFSFPVWFPISSETGLQYSIASEACLWICLSGWIHCQGQLMPKSIRARHLRSYGAFDYCEACR